MFASHAKRIASNSTSRVSMWGDIIRSSAAIVVAEIGVYRGEFAAQILTECDGIRSYYMIDPWRHLSDWNKPANQQDQVFDEFFLETMEKTEFAAEKRVILRGKTTEMIEHIPDGSVDVAYIDGDHTLKGISIDLIRVWPKIRQGGLVGGDDFSATIWQHERVYEPTLVFPFAVYFAEAVGAPIFGLPHSQFMIEKREGYAFHDLTGEYEKTDLLSQLGLATSAERDLT